MRFNEIEFDSSLPVDGYGPGFFRLGDAMHEGAMLIAPDGVSGWGGLDDLAALTALEGKVDVILLGLGADIRPAPPTLVQAVEDAGIGVEPMATPSACRTYNILLSEGRRIALAVLPV